MSAATGFRGLLLGVGIALLSGCAHKGAPPLYMWESFPKLQYDTLLRSGSPDPEQVIAMEAHAEAARGAGAALPPGFRAHWGLLKLSAGDPDQARQLWEAEKAAFPESAPYIDQLLKQLTGVTKKDKPT
jgi:hypothetical protein